MLMAGWQQQRAGQVMMMVGMGGWGQVMIIKWEPHYVRVNYRLKVEWQ